MRVCLGSLEGKIAPLLLQILEYLEYRHKDQINIKISVYFLRKLDRLKAVKIRISVTSPKCSSETHA